MVKIPKSHSATSTNPPSRCNTTTASSSLPVRPLPKAHTVSTTATGRHQRSHTPASTTLTHTHAPYCTTSTLPSTTNSLGQIASFAQSTTHPLSNRPSTVARLSSALSPVPPSPFSTPQRVYSTTSAARRRFPGPAGILPALVCLEMHTSA